MVLNANTFQDVASSVGINWSRQRGDEAFSLSFTDFNGDGLPDIWVSGHGYNGAGALFPAKFPSLYINNGNGTFTNLFPEDFRQGIGGDTHVAHLVDFDNDGDADVFVTSGGQLGGLVGEEQGQANLFFNTRISQLGILTEEGAERNVQDLFARGRSTLWFDGNGDGLLDFIELVATQENANGQLEEPTAYYQQNADGTFSDLTTTVGLNVDVPSRYAQLADLTGDGKLDLVIQGVYQFPAKVYDFSSGNGFQDVTNNFNFPLISDIPADSTEDFEDHDSARDSIIADFDGDGDNDIFLVRSNISTTAPSVFQGTNNRVVSADLILQNPGQEIGYSFTTGGSVAIDFFDLNGLAALLSPSEIFIGASGRNPTAAELEAFVNISSGSTAPATANNNPSTPANDPVAALLLNSTSAGVNGLASERSTRGVYIGYNSATQTWEIRLNSSTFENIRSAVESTQNITNLTPINFTNVNPASKALTNQFWRFDSNTGKFVNDSIAAGFITPTLGQSTVEGDFDNDKDLDIYVVNSYSSFNQPNILYENQGNGTFTTVAQGGGAAGTTLNFGWLDFQVGSRVATADYDQNGFLDIFLGSTIGRSPRKTYLANPSQLFQNQGNANNWIQIDLQGTQSNRDGIGAQVRVTSGGVTQLREQGSGTHHFAQNSQTLHFGLAQDGIISSIEIKWPSGVTQILNNVAVNQVLNIIETFASNLVGNNSSNTLNGTTGADQINGLGSSDNLNGNNGSDSLIGGSGNDSILGSEGNDTLLGDSDNDTLLGGNNNDNLNGGSENDRLEGNLGDDTLDGGSGDDTLLGSAGYDYLLGGNGNDSLAGDTDDDFLDGQIGLDSLNGGNGNDTLNGGTDNDLLNGDGGNDSLVGFDGSDVLNGGDGADTLTDDLGNDTLRGNNNNDLLQGGDGNDSLYGGDGVDTLFGNNENDNLLGEGGNDSLDGGTGNDTLQGGAGNDSLYGGEGSDRILETGDSNFVLTNTQLTGKGTDIFSSIESVRLVGAGSANTLNASAVTQFKVILEGSGGNDTIIGGSGNDDLTGGVGNDVLTGGAGADRFLYTEFNHRIDTITDFVAGQDSLVFDASAFGGGLIPGILSAAQFVLGSSAADGDDRFIYNNTDGKLFFDSNGNAAGSQVLVATLANIPTFSNQSITIVP